MSEHFPNELYIGNRVLLGMQANSGMLLYVVYCNYALMQCKSFIKYFTTFYNPGQMHRNIYQEIKVYNFTKNDEHTLMRQMARQMETMTRSYHVGNCRWLASAHCVLLLIPFLDLRCFVSCHVYTTMAQIC